MLKGKFRNNFYFLIIVFIFYFFIFNFLLPDLKIFAQELKNYNPPTTLPGGPSEECKTRAECEALLKEYEEQISQYEKDIEKTQKEKKTLQNQIYILKRKIEKLNLQIKESNVMIQDVSLQIKDTESSIEETSLKIEDSKQRLATILRTIYEEDQKTLLEILLSEKELSDFFDNLMYLESLNRKNKELLKNIKNLKSYLESQKKSLDEEKADLENILKMQTLQRQEAHETKKKQESFLKLTEAQYQKYLKEKEETEKIAAEIRARLWQLIGVREAPKYEDAVKIAQEISKITGIRAAFILGILTQESNIGKNVGQCYLQDPNTGMGIKFRTGQKWPRVMKPEWVPLFKETINQLNEKKKLNLDLYATPISCWIPACYYQGNVITSGILVDREGKITCPKGVPFGWGGAMGPAQLMPFNWIGSDNYKNRIEAITKRVADPWDFYDAVLGAALHLKDCRADLSERQAAACYFGGWGNRNRSYHLRAYADPVLKLSQCHQEFIDTGSMSIWCEERIF